MLEWKKRRYRTLNTVEVEADALRHNLRIYKNRCAGRAVAPVLKSNAYGHGLLNVAPILAQQEPPFLVVDSLYEAYEMSKKGIQAPVLILGYTSPENLKRCRQGFHFTVADLETAQALASRGASVHLKIDTGMQRMGFKMNELTDVLPRLKAMKLKVTGLFTHLADADNPEDDAYNTEQIQHFRAAIEQVRQAGFDPQWIHVGGGGGMMAARTLPKEINMIRLGLGTYGISPIDRTHDIVKNRDPHLAQLRPAMRVTSTLVGVRTVKPGDRIGYNGTFLVQNEMQVGTVPFGYYEGLPRELSNTGSIEIGGKICPIVGRISMNYCVVELKEEAHIGDPVVIYSNDPTKPHSIEQVAQSIGRIPYELLVNIAESVRRVMV